MNELKRAFAALLIISTSLAVVLLGIFASLGDSALSASAQAKPCQAPPGWELGPAIGPDDTLEEVARRNETTAAEVRAANCLPEGPVSLTGRRLYLPAPP